MRLIEVIVHPHNAEFRPACVRCNNQLNSKRDTLYADADGVPYRDYYCVTCKKEIDNG